MILSVFLQRIQVLNITSPLLIMVAGFMRWDMAGECLSSTDLLTNGRRFFEASLLSSLSMVVSKPLEQGLAQWGSMLTRWSPWPKKGLCIRGGRLLVSSMKSRLSMPYLPRYQTDMGKEMAVILGLSEHCQGEGTMHLWHTLNLCRCECISILIYTLVPNLYSFCHAEIVWIVNDF